MEVVMGQGVDLAFAALAFLVGASVTALGDESHFSWWSLGVFYVYCIARALHYAEYVACFALVCTTIVVAGVIIMSIMECGTLLETAVHNKWEYLIGTFLMHYLPFAVVAGDGKYASARLQLALVQSTAVGAGFAIYLGQVSPQEAYRCDVPVGWTIVAAFVSAGLFTLILAR